MKFGVHMLYFNQDKWILKTIENCAPFVDKIYIAWSEKPWNYNENKASSHRINRLAKQI